MTFVLQSICSSSDLWPGHLHKGLWGNDKRIAMLDKISSQIRSGPAFDLYSGQPVAHTEQLILKCVLSDTGGYNDDDIELSWSVTIDRIILHEFP